MLLFYMEDIRDFSITDDYVNSSFNIMLGKRRSGKSYLCEYYINELKKNNLCDICFLFSMTDAGFEDIDRECRFTDISKLNNILENVKKINLFNKLVSSKEQIKLNIIIILDDCAIKLKSKEFNILEELAVNGRHSAYPPLSLSFFILTQSLTKVSRIVRLNADRIFLNSISSSIELEMVLAENFYLLKSDRAGKVEGRNLYHSMVLKNPFQFIVIENHRQNVTEYSDYLKLFRAEKPT